MPQNSVPLMQNENPDLNEQKQNFPDEKALFLKAYLALDHLKDQHDLDDVITQLKNCHSFNAYYLLGELYRYGVTKNVNSHTIILPTDTSLASEYFLKAYELNSQIKVLIHNTETISSMTYSAMTIKNLTDLTKIAEKGNAEALFQLGEFFESEFKMEQRKTSLMPQQLKRLAKSCFIAAADLYHPHAAFKAAAIIDNQADKMRYSIIAADPVFARFTLRENVQLFELRGYNETSSFIELDPPNNVLPTALLMTTSLSFAKMSGIFTSSTEHQSSKSILPSTYHESSEAHQLSEGSHESLSKDEMRKKRFQKFGPK